MDKSKRQALDKNIKQLFGARMTSKGIANNFSLRVGIDNLLIIFKMSNKKKSTHCVFFCNFAQYKITHPL